MVDQSAVGREFTRSHARVEPGRLRFFLDTLGGEQSASIATRTRHGRPATQPRRYRRRICFCLELMDATVPFEFLTALNIDLARVLHGEQAL